MRRSRMLLAGLAVTVAVSAFPALGRAGCYGPRLSIGVGFGYPGYYRPWGPYYYPPPYYYQPYPVVVASPPPPPVIVQQIPAPQPAPVSQPVYPAPAPRLVPTPTQPATTQTQLTSHSPSDRQQRINEHLRALTNPSVQVRSDSVMQLGRLKARRAVDPLAATLSGDSSPIVRESAARALGLIAAPGSLVALRHAAQTDSDHDVRRSAQFAVEVIESRAK